MFFLDSETCGFHGLAVLLQWAEDEGEINLHSIWHEPIQDTLELIERFCDSTICGFNLTFDMFHLCKIYTTFYQAPNKKYCPLDYTMDEIVEWEDSARFVDLCLKPQAAVDLMLVARKGPYQSTMKRKDLRIRKVPTALAWRLRDELDSRIPLKDIYFTRAKNRHERWQVQDIADDFGDINPSLKDLVLKFSPSSALKALAVDAGVAREHRLMYGDIALPTAAMPFEFGYAPYANAIKKAKEIWKGTKKIREITNNGWPEMIHMHIQHWAFNTLAREYASDDVADTRALYHFFEDPQPDNDSNIACAVGASRWAGFAVDTDGIEKLRQEKKKQIQEIKFNFNAPQVCKKYIMEVMTPIEKLSLKYNDKTSTKASILEAISKWRAEVICDKCEGEGCDQCGGEGVLPTGDPHPAASRAQEILKARRAKKELEIYEKLLIAGRLQPDFVIVGTRSNRKAGTGGLNPQGINKAKYVRNKFPLADGGMVLCGGDFDAFEITLADAAYNDETLRKELMEVKTCHKCGGKGCPKCKGTGKVRASFHGILGSFFFAPMTYEEILATDGLPGDKDIYKKSKGCTFLILYGGDDKALVIRLGIPADKATEGYNNFVLMHPQWGAERKKIFDEFCSMRQPNGIGTKVEWHEPAEYIESMLGFKRYFTLENSIVKALFDMAEQPPKEWKEIRYKIVRRDREQTAHGALRSAILGAAFQIQAANMRAAANHVIQSTGAELVKELEMRLLALQPAGVNRWRIKLLNEHDELEVCTLPSLIPEVSDVVRDFVTEHKKTVPLLGITWKESMNTWADK